MWKNANPIQERIAWAATLLPWWVNLILAELSFIILYLMSSGLVAQIIIPSLFAGASMVSTLKSDREKEELHRLRKETAKNGPTEPEPEAIKPDLKIKELRRVKKNQVDIENMPVTKVIVKDLMKGTYREIYQKPRNWEPKEENCREEEQRRERRKSEAIIGVSIALFLSTAVATWIYIYFAPKEEQIAVNIPKPEPQKQTVSVNYTSPARPSPAPIQSQQNWKQYAYSKQPDNFEIEKPIPIEDDSTPEESEEKIYAYIKNGIVYYTDSAAKIDLIRKKGIFPSRQEQKPEPEKVLSYKVSLKNGSTIDCKNIIKLRQGILTLIDDKLRMDIPVEQINDMEKKCEIPNGIRVTVITPDSF